MEVKVIKNSLRALVFGICRSIGLQLILALLLTIPQSMAMTTPEDTGNDAYPKFWTSISHYFWVGKEAVQPDSLSLKINNNPVKREDIELVLYEGIPHLHIPLEYGTANLISIRHGNTPLFLADIFYAFTYEQRLAPEEYLYNPFHVAKNEAACKRCHRLEVNEYDLSPSKPADNICNQCHRSKFTDITFQHKAAGINWECLKCHQTEATESVFEIDSPVKFSIQEGHEVAPLCYNCHKDKKQEYKDYKYVHGPIAMEGCNMCHNPHGSNTAKLLQKDISTMCINCHELQSIMEQPVIHKPLSDKGCTGCHNPHGSNSEFFLEAGINTICTKCHPHIQANDHPIMGHPVSAEVDPIMTYRTFSCVSCHDAHSSEHDKLLGEDEIMMLCVKCHPFGS